MLLNELLYWLLCLICVGLILWGLRFKERIYQAPFVMGAMFASFILPQGLGIVYQESELSDIIILRLLVMSCLCAINIWIGYKIPIPKYFLCKPAIEYNRNKIINVAFIYVVLGILFWVLIFRLPGGYGLKTVGQSTGIFTIYILFARNFSYVGFVITIFEFIYRPNRAKLLLLILASIMPAGRVIFFGRRTITGFLLLSIGVATYFQKHRLPPRLLIVSIVISAFILIPFIGDQRGLLSNRWDASSEISITQGLEDIVSGEDTKELRNAALIIDTTINKNAHGWGKTYWNRMIFRYIPAQLLGSNFKKNLQLEMIDVRDYFYNSYGYKRQIGTTSTGIGDSFSQFDYFGCLVFGLIAFVSKLQWFSAYTKKDYLAQIRLPYFLTASMLAVTHGTQYFLPEVFGLYMFTIPILFFKQKTSF